MLQPLDRCAAEILSKPHRKLLKQAKNLEDQDMEARHEVPEDPGVELRRRARTYVEVQFRTAKGVDVASVAAAALGWHGLLLVLLYATA